VGTFDGVISGTGVLAKAGNGEQKLTGNNTYSGGTILSPRGTIEDVLGKLDVNGSSALGTGPITLNGSALNSLGNATLANPFTCNGGAIAFAADGTFIFSGPGATNGPSSSFGLRVTSDGVHHGTVTFSGVLSGGGGLSVESETVLLTRANSYLSGTVISSNSVSLPDFLPVPGIVRLGTANALPGSGIVFLERDSILDLNNFNATIDSLEDGLRGAGNVILGTAILTVSSVFSGNFSGSISGSGGLIKAGTGAQILGGNNTYTGSTTISAGTLIVNGTLSSSVAVNSGATLGGTGTVGTITNAGTISPGTPKLGEPGTTTGILSSGTATFNTGSTFSVKLNGTTAGTDYDRLNSSGTVSLTGATLNVTAGFAAAVGNTFTIITSSGPLIGTFNGLPDGSSFNANGQTFRANYTSNSVLLTRVFPTTTTVVSSANPSNFGQPVTFTASVSGGSPSVAAPTGSIVFTIDGTAQSPVPLTNGQATLSTAALGTGTHTITAAYSGDANFNTSTSSAVTQTVNKANTTTTIEISRGAFFSAIFSIVARVAAVAPGVGTPTGTVTFTADGTALAPVTLSSGQATLFSSALTPGTHTITAAYSGDNNFNSSTSSALPVLVILSGTATTLTSSANPSTPGQAVTFTATVSSMFVSTLTGTVVFTIDGTRARPSRSRRSRRTHPSRTRGVRPLSPRAA
jgi:autotransporter-associated beta strand protein